MKFLKIFLVLLGFTVQFGQSQTSPPTQDILDHSLVKNLPFENIGPSIMSGRVTDLAVNPEMTSEFYVAYASGGLWHTTNNGTSFTPILDGSQTQNVGALAVHWPTRTIWVGTGENNSSRSSYAGIGMLKSTDNGKTWEHLGLSDSHHIGNILINPNDPDEVVVGVVGHLYSPNEERGVFKTVDGGKSWIRTLFVDDTSGIIEIQHEPGNFNVQYAASWTKDRKAWNFLGNGENSAIFKSTDAGSSWTKVSTPNSGFPTGDGVGLIGLAVFDANTIYAVHDSQFLRPAENSKAKGDELSKDDFKVMSKQQFLTLEDKKLEDFLQSNGFPKKYSASAVKDLVRKGKAEPVDLAKFLEDANAMLFDTPVVGAEVYVSRDGGKSWGKTHKGYLDGVYSSYGYYFGKIHVSPTNKEDIYIYGVPIIKSKDGGATFSSIDYDNVHSDHHALWINPNNPNHLINGNDGGINISYDDGAHWIKCNSPEVGQFYYINVDDEKPYNVYGGLQDNGVWVGANNADEDASWHQNGQYPWKFIMGGDGMQVQIDNRNSKVVYTGYQFGNYYRLNLDTQESVYIQPKHELGYNPYRFNWQTPVFLSAHNQDILYYGANKLLRSMNQGNDWSVVSPDLTTGGKKGNVAYGTLTSISESPFQFGKIVVGSDDGYVHLTQDGGVNWTKISDSFPKDLWVSRVVASEHDQNRIYVTLNGYRWDDFKTYIYLSNDLGATWTEISGNIPASPVNVIIEDPVREDMLYVGTDYGLYLSLDSGASWHALAGGMPHVAVHDLKIQKTANHLLVGTHGRSIYRAEIGALQALTNEVLNQNVHVFALDKMRKSPSWGRQWSQFRAANTPELNIPYFSKTAQSLQFMITDKEDNEVYSSQVSADKGLNTVIYDLSYSEKALKKLKNNAPKASDNGVVYLAKGTYKVMVGNASKELVIE